MHALVHSRLDYCNSVLVRLPWSLVQQLQSVLNSAARLIFGLKRFDRITPALMDLHWLPYPQRITYKLCMIMFKCLRGSAPAQWRIQGGPQGAMAPPNGLKKIFFFTLIKKIVKKNFSRNSRNLIDYPPSKSGRKTATSSTTPPPLEIGAGKLINYPPSNSRPERKFAPPKFNS